MAAHPAREPDEIIRSSGQQELLEKIRHLSKLMDTQFEIPGIGIRFGLDSIVGLLPGIGDSIGLAASSYIVSLAARAGAPRSALIRMVGNVIIDAIIGLIPILGDILDVGFKANRRNLDILLHCLDNQHLRPRSNADTASELRGTLLTIIIVAIVLTLLPFIALIAILT